MHVAVSVSSHWGLGKFNCYVIKTYFFLDICHISVLHFNMNDAEDAVLFFFSRLVQLTDCDINYNKTETQNNPIMNYSNRL